MKKTVSTILAALLLGAALIGCSGETPSTSEKTSATSDQPSEQRADNGFADTVTLAGVAITMHADAAPIVAALGEPSRYYESASCAFTGLDKEYTYPGFVLYTYPDGETDRVSAVLFTDDSRTTDAGLYIGSSESAITEKYGENYTKEGENYFYSSATARLTILVSGGSVSSIQYAALYE